MREIKLLSEYKDKVTGFVGTATIVSRSETGPSRVCLEKLNHEGTDIKELWFDESRLIEIKDADNFDQVAQPGSVNTTDKESTVLVGIPKDVLQGWAAPIRDALPVKFCGCATCRMIEIMLEAANRG